MHMPISPILAQARYASTSSLYNFPFPKNSHPTPHQIFHLPIGASQQDIKTRYYDLVREHHPDSPFCRDVTPEVRHSRFRAITAAYDTLRGRGIDPYHAEIELRRRAQRAREVYERRAESAGKSTAQGREWTASADDRWKDWVLISIGIMSLGAGLGPALLWPAHNAGWKTHINAAANLAQARRDAREFGEERRREISRRVQEHKQSQKQVDIHSEHT
ncbi:hypothetical protein A0H81_06493 [Grifola frondosa]|uniref:J domain-containing protein n=1 Tax=Grifola frondosa TaxID=5627 RepID=A0A1C7MAW5_GRIFR|nr:hypothetical protein A0H81_06493 [Grifola frondosa]